VPVTEAVLSHESEQVEAGGVRQVTVELALLALGQAAQWLQGAPLGGAVQVTGFLAAKSQNSKMPVLHVTSIEFLEGN
jgi:primosomal replication protein N